MPPRWLTVLTYHRIGDRDDPDDLDPALVSASPAEFERQVAWLAQNTTPLTLDEVLEVQRGDAALPRRAVLVTFDDAYRDFAEVAWPLLQAHGVPAVLFVATGFPGSDGHGFWWDRLHRAVVRTRRRDPLPTRVGELRLETDLDRRRTHRALVALIHSMPHDDAMGLLERTLLLLDDADPLCPVLDWDELRALARSGVAVAPHTRTHARLDRVSDERAREELAGSRADLQRELGHCPPVFAFPAGGHDGRSVGLLEEAGFAVGFTTKRGGNNVQRADWRQLRRSNMGRRSTLPMLRAQLRPLAARTLGALG